MARSSTSSAISMARRTKAALTTEVRYSELFSRRGGVWTETILYSFNPNDGDGFYPAAGLVFEFGCSLYGTTSEGGTSGYGRDCLRVVARSGREVDRRKCCATATAGMDGTPRRVWFSIPPGNLYGTTQYLGSADGGGTVFRLTPNEDGTWTNRVLTEFSTASAVMDSTRWGSSWISAGNLYGTTADGRQFTARVSPLECRRTSAGQRRFYLNFGGKAGYGPLAGPILDSAGNLYGTA